MEKITVGIIGIGGYGELSLDNIFSAMDEGRDDFEIVAFVDPYPKASRHYERLTKMNVPYYCDIKDMYDAHIHPNLCLISTPIQFHKEHICYCHSHWSSVLCEKPLTGNIDDMWMLEHSESDCSGFIAIGYQWSFSEAITELKKDIMNGVYGKPKSLKTLVMWPRDKKYFTRSTGWAGKVYAQNGEKILDSVANNATAHYIHNILYVLGKTANTSAEASDVSANLIRVNDIETFDTVISKFKIDKDADGLFIATHSSKDNVNPQFEYTFEKGKITFSEKQGEIIGTTLDGKTINYGDPFKNPTKKFFDCIDLIKEQRTDVPCGVLAASAQVRFITQLHDNNKIYNADASKVRNADERLYLEGLDEKLLSCYNENRILTDAEMAELVKP